MMLFKPATRLSVCVSVFPADAGNISGKFLRSKWSSFTLAAVCHYGRFTMLPFFCLRFGSVFCRESMIMKKSAGPDTKRTCWLRTYICHQPHIDAISESTCRIIKEHQCYGCKRRDILFRKVKCQRAGIKTYAIRHASDLYPHSWPIIVLNQFRRNGVIDEDDLLAQPCYDKK